MTNETTFDPKVQEAIKAALENNWEKALQLNQELIKKYPNDIDTNNRLARSYRESGQINQAKIYYQKVLKLDPYNPIAEKNLKRLSSIKKNDIDPKQIQATVKSDTFLEEPGKTITTVLEDTAMPSVLAGLWTGDEVFLSKHHNNVAVLSSSGKRIGKIENGLAKNLAEHLRTGSKFESFIKSIILNEGSYKKGKSHVTIFIREKYRSPKIVSAPFPSDNYSFTPYVREEALSLLSNQTPLQTEADDAIEEIEVSQLPSVNTPDQSLEELAEKEQEEDDSVNND